MPLVLPRDEVSRVLPLLAAATAGLAAWNAHLHQSVQSLKAAPKKTRT